MLPLWNETGFGSGRMTIPELFLIALGLSMDAFAVSVCKGLSTGRLQPRRALQCGAYFGGFQALMPVLGYLLGGRFQRVIASIDHWVAFVLLSVIGLNMIRQSFAEERLDDDWSAQSMLPLAIATSIDALAVGVTFSFFRVKIIPTAAMIGTTAFVLSALGVLVGAVSGERFRGWAGWIGGTLLLGMGAKILLEHLEILI